MLRYLLNKKLNSSHEKLVIDKINHLSDSKHPVAKIPETHQCLYIEGQELAGFFYLNFYMVSDLDFETHKGSSITFFSQDQSFVLNSESKTVESNYSINAKIGITKFECDLELDFLQFLEMNKVNKINFEGNNNLRKSLSGTKAEFEWVDHELLSLTVRSTLQA